MLGWLQRKAPRFLSASSLEKLSKAGKRKSETNTSNEGKVRSDEDCKEGIREA